jgi:hypothetical protein
MKAINRITAVCALGFLAISQHAAASPPGESAAGFAFPDGSSRMFENVTPVPKSALAQTLGSRATATSTATVYGGFELRSTTLVYILVRGNSLGTLGITQSYLDAPRVRVYDSQQRDIAFDNNGNPGFNLCLTSSTVTAPVRSFYSSVRGVPAVDRDSCITGTLDAGSYSFSVTPSIPGVTTVTTLSIPAAGEILFEVTLNPL